MGLGEEEMMPCVICVIPAQTQSAAIEEEAPRNGGCKITTN